MRTYGSLPVLFDFSGAPGSTVEMSAGAIYAGFQPSTKLAARRFNWLIQQQTASANRLWAARAAAYSQGEGVYYGADKKIGSVVWNAYHKVWCAIEDNNDGRLFYSADGLVWYPGATFAPVSAATIQRGGLDSSDYNGSVFIGLNDVDALSFIETSDPLDPDAAFTTTALPDTIGPCSVCNGPRLAGASTGFLVWGPEDFKAALASTSPFYDVGDSTSGIPLTRCCQYLTERKWGWIALTSAGYVYSEATVPTTLSANISASVVSNISDDFPDFLPSHFDYNPVTGVRIVIGRNSGGGSIYELMILRSNDSGQSRESTTVPVLDFGYEGTVNIPEKVMCLGGSFWLLRMAHPTADATLSTQVILYSINDGLTWDYCAAVSNAAELSSAGHCDFDFNGRQWLGFDVADGFASSLILRGSVL